MDDHPLANVWAKLDRGDKHVKAFEHALDRLFAKKHPPAIHVVQQLDADESEWVVYIAKVDPLPLQLGLIVGDAIHNFRTALDQLVFELAFMDSGGTEITTTQFPASLCLANFRSNHVQKRLLAGLTTRHRTTIKRIQPCRSRNNSGWPHPIALLDDLSNDDKHRLTQPVLGCLQEFRFTFAGATDCYLPAYPLVASRNFLGFPLESATEILRVSVVVTGPDPVMDVKCESTFFVAFRNGLPANVVLRGIAEWARRIVEAFEPEFERPKALRLRGRPRYGRIQPVMTPPEAYARIVRPFLTSRLSQFIGRRLPMRVGL